MKYEVWCSMHDGGPLIIGKPLVEFEGRSAKGAAEFAAAKFSCEEGIVDPINVVVVCAKGQKFRYIVRPSQHIHWTASRVKED